MSSVIVVAGCRCRCRGTADFFSVFGAWKKNRTPVTGIRTFVTQGANHCAAVVRR